MNWHEWPEPIQRAAVDAARAVSRIYPEAIPREDLEQEALVYIATHYDEIEKRAHNPNYVFVKVRDRMSRLAAREAKRQAQEEPLPEGWELGDI